MALTEFQRRVLGILAATRREHESYVAGGVALNTLLAASRISHDIDLFHDSDEAVARTWEADRALLMTAGITVDVVRARPGFVEAELHEGRDAVLIQWVRDSAFRFFPLVSDPQLGMTLHPFDLATNKVLALVGRVEPRDWIDLMRCIEELQGLGLLAWAACGKDPGFSPSAIIEEAARTARYAPIEIESLAFDGPPPDPRALARTWHHHLAEARAVIAELPGDHAGECVMSTSGELFRGCAAELRAAIAGRAIHFHRGRLRGAFPQLVERKG
jgi:hypothetical protein